MYTPISQRENIEDEDIAKIADYLERVAKYFLLRKDGYNNIILDVDDFCIFPKKVSKIYKDKYCIIEIPLRILAENIVGIYGSLKHNK